MILHTTLQWLRQGVEHWSEVVLTKYNPYVTLTGELRDVDGKSVEKIGNAKTTAHHILWNSSKQLSAWNYSPYLEQSNPYTIYVYIYVYIDTYIYIYHVHCFNGLDLVLLCYLDAYDSFTNDFQCYFSGSVVTVLMPMKYPRMMQAITAHPSKLGPSSHITESHSHKTFSESF